MMYVEIKRKYAHLIVLTPLYNFFEIKDAA